MTESNLWQAVCDARDAFVVARLRFLSGATDRVATLRAALSGQHRRLALETALALSDAERMELFEDLVDLASVGHSDIDAVRRAILSLPRAWVVASIERAAAPVLEAGDEEDYRRLLELYSELDADLTDRLVQLALAHSHPEVQAVGEDFRRRRE
ncbi:hypothetical protein [Actinomycetospora cinnamomea]|uniref:Uncharacterized protein n=1 Tax=Actinomycetospora cinnamomea TaxID=663609 RepID=A0A2U1F7T6_9PSEU|nr:hypothetical protein [Actinomycetospora cinnamomea]PVZ08209.1 hypothetical protein C8D89_10992 [Actinomycetospora cinnamomea]